MRPLSARRNNYEFWVMIAQMCAASLEMLVAATFLLLDHLLILGMQIVADHARIEFEQHGEHIVDIRVNGTGIVAGLVRRATANVNFIYSLNVTGTNEQCLPQPQHLATVEYMKMVSLYLFIMFLIYIETYLQRLRHCICAYFYWRREKQRVLHVYNATMKKRRGLLRQIMAQVEEQLRARGRAGVTFGGACHKVPMCWWLRWFAVCRRRCIVCEELEPFHSKTDAIVECALCMAMYCAECWREVGAVCLVCQCMWRQRGGGEEAEDWWYDDRSPYASDQSDYDL